jgi:putative NIF3 family GTP cyclohydrolase 1 type 2
LYAAKVDLLRTHDIVVFRIHDHMHAQRPDFTYVGSARDVGLDARYETAPGSHRFVIPETTLGALAADVKRRTGARALRVVGDPAAKVRRIQLGVGYATPAVNTPDVDVVISGEQQEADGGFDSPEYVLDATTLGIAKGWIMLGHVVSEEAGMLEMAQWIKGFVPEVPVELVQAGEPFWTPR